jgi:hypothetical protein
MNTSYFLIFMLLVLWETSPGCGDATDSPATSKAEIVGTYKGRYASGTETFEIHDDGTFLQTYRGGTNAGYTSTGKWLYETNAILNGQSVKMSRFTFKPLMVPAGVSVCTTNTKFDVSSGAWRRNPFRIELGPWPYLVAKSKEAERIKNE